MHRYPIDLAYELALLQRLVYLQQDHGQTQLTTQDRGLNRILEVRLPVTAWPSFPASALTANLRVGDMCWVMDEHRSCRPAKRPRTCRCS